MDAVNATPCEDFAGLRLYIAGPMRGYPKFNAPEFDRVTAALRAKGHTVFNPAEHDRELYGADVHSSSANAARVSMRDVLADDLWWICQEADGIVLLPGWLRSKGACAEKAAAEALGLTVYVPEQLIGY